MTSKEEALKMAMYELEIVGLKDGDTYNACKEALEQPSNMVAVPLDKLQDMQRRLKALEQPTVAELNDEYLRDTHVIGLEQPAEPRLVSYALDGSTCTLNIDGEEVYFNREQPAQEVECSNHPDAPHGFCRDASHSAGRYVCECEGWEVEQSAQDYVLICKKCGDDLGIEYVPDEQQEPYAYAYKREDGVGQLCWTKRDASLFKDLLDGWKEIPLYTDEALVLSLIHI